MKAFDSMASHLSGIENAQPTITPKRNAMAPSAFIEDAMSTFRPRLLPCLLPAALPVAARRHRRGPRHRRRPAARARSASPCATASASSSSAPYSARCRRATARRVVTHAGVPPGSWAVLAYQDENANGELDRNLIGIPSENYGFSRDARGRFGPPSFDDAAIDVKDDAAAATVATVRLR